MILDEKLYAPSLPPEERGKGAWDRTKPRRTSLGKRQRDDSITGMDGPKRKLRRTASTKLNSQSEGLWGDIVAGGGGMVAQVPRSGVWESTDEQLPEESSHALKHEMNASSIRTEVAPDPPTIEGIFSGCRFYLGGFEPKKSQILADHLLPNGAELSSTIEGLLALSSNDSPIRLFRIIPSAIPERKRFKLPPTEAKVETITEWWVERCLHHKTFFEPSDHVIGRPFPKFPIEEFRQMTISSAAFTGIDLLHVKKAVELIGAKYSEDMTPQSSILLAKSVVHLRKDKADHAREWEIPIVNAAWLWDSITGGEILPIQKYRFKQPKRAGSVPPEKIFSKPKERPERSKSDLGKSFSKADDGSINPSRPSRSSKLDTTAFISDEPLPVKETDSQDPLPTTNISNASTESCSSKSEPLSEINLNSTSRTVSTAPAPSDHPAPRPQEDLSDDISNLLSKTKAAAQPAQIDEGRKRGVNRILGRAASNVSAASTPFSRASSVDSTATHGNPVEYPSNTNNSGKAASGQTEIEHLIAGHDRNKEKELESQPSSTQLQYDDPESKEYKERVMARMLGEKVDPKTRKGLTKEKGLTLGDISEGLKPRVRRKPAPGFR
jgi:DNA replication regulator DPB11